MPTQQELSAAVVAMRLHPSRHGLTDGDLASLASAALSAADHVRQARLEHGMPCLAGLDWSFFDSIERLHGDMMAFLRYPLIVRIIWAAIPQALLPTPITRYRWLCFAYSRMLIHDARQNLIDRSRA